MEWINEPNVNKSYESSDETHPMCGAVFFIGGAIVCKVEGLLCDNLCGIYFG